MTKQTFVNYLEQIKGYDKYQVKDILSQMRDFGTPMQDYLTQEEVSDIEAMDRGLAESRYL